jgi:uncharacterized protein YgiM (DUF1202 family)
MRAVRFLSRTIIPALTCALLWSCTAVRTRPLMGTYYVTSEVAYLRDSPAYESHVLGQLYKGDQVENLESTPSAWWRVRSGRTGQEGWIQESFLSLTPAPITYYYVSREVVPLRECPGEACPSLQLLYQGDEVQQVQKNDQGWCRVLVTKGRGLGWVPEKALAEQQVLNQPGNARQNYYYVAVDRLKLHQQPLTAAKVLKTLEFNNQLVKLAESPSGWFKVRQPSSGAVGWVEARHLESLPQQFPRRTKRHKKQVPQAPVPEPEVM